MKSLLLLTLLAAGKFGHQEPTENSQICQPDDFQYAAPSAPSVQPTWPYISEHLPEDSLVRLVCESTPDMQDESFSCSYLGFCKRSPCSRIDAILKDANFETHQLDIDRGCWDRFCSSREGLRFSFYSDPRFILRCAMHQFEDLSPDQKWSEHRMIQDAANKIAAQRPDENPYSIKN